MNILDELIVLGNMLNALAQEAVEMDTCCEQCGYDFDDVDALYSYYGTLLCENCLLWEFDELERDEIEGIASIRLDGRSEEDLPEDLV